MNHFSKEIDENVAKKGSGTGSNKLLEEAKVKFAEFEKLELALEKKMDEYYEMTGSSARETKEKLKSPHNFTQAELDEIQRVKEQLLGPLKNLKTTKKSTKKLEEGKKQSEDKGSRKIRGKLRGIKQNWIPVK